MKISAKIHTFIFFAFTIVIFTACLVAICFLSGFNHEVNKIKIIGLHLLLVILAQFVISDTVKFILIAIDKATWPIKEKIYRPEKAPLVHTRTDYLKMRLNSLKAELRYGTNHLSEPLNLRFQLISVDLFLYGTYFVLLTMMVLVTRDGLLYHNTSVMSKIFLTNRTYTIGLDSIHEFDQFYTFVELTLVNGFDSNVAKTGYHSWVYGDHTAKLGVIRMRQLRRKEMDHMGWEPPKYSSRDYMPNWKLPYERRPYTDKYWNIYSPWLPSSVKYSFMDKVFLSYKHDGYFENYPETVGYITMLARNRNNSMKVIDYLKTNNWVTRQTAAVFIDFTLYNADANIFTVCTLLLEQTPFGTLMATAQVNSMKMLILEELGALGFVVATLYTIVFLQFAKNLVITLWFEPSKLRSMWNKLDLLILVLNVVMVILIVMQEIIVANLLERIECANKLQFVDFHKPAHLKNVSKLVLGILVLLTTLRLWKVLQFASVFQLFSYALFSAWQAIASMAIIIVVFIVGFSIAVAIINGNNTNTFNYIMRSISNSMCFSFGFSQHISYMDLFYGGKIMGMVLYFILVFVVTQLLINVFVSLINGFFGYAKLVRDARAKQPINFLQFLRIEYYAVFQVFKKLPCLNRGYRRNNRTVADNIRYFLDQRQVKSSKNRYQAWATATLRTERDLDEATKQEHYKIRILRVFNIATVMQTQIQLLEHLWVDQGKGGQGMGSRLQRDDYVAESDSDDESF
ncbi:hypothetical protein KR044_008415 [Drosophila immigrans]|nr:hypothetical protein KR044_008415 [Drosophila immigrans]